MSTYCSNSADIGDKSSKQQRSAAFAEIARQRLDLCEEIVSADKSCLNESTIRKRTCPSNPSDIEDSDSEQQRLATFKEIAQQRLSLFKKNVRENESCLNESTVRKRACSSSHSDIEDGDYKRQLLALEDDSSADSVDKDGSLFESEKDEDGSSADYVNLNPQEKDKLNAFLEEMVTKACVDFRYPEIQDIQSAVSEMIERIRTWINERDVFHISRTELCGSMAEETAMWKLHGRSKQPFIEFDFLAVLQTACDIKADCPDCFYVNTPPANLELHEIYSHRLYNPYTKGIGIETDRLAACFTKETNDCLSSCGCLEVKYMELISHDDWDIYTFEPSSTCSKTQHGCGKCTVDRHSGTLRVKTSEQMGMVSGNNCSLMFVWTSKAKTLCTRDEWCLPETGKMDNLTIHIDFLPVLEVFKSKQRSVDVTACYSSDLVLSTTSSEYEHYCFLVPKHCVTCKTERRKNTWRKSGCRAEIDTVINKMTNKHRNCYQNLKCLIELLNRVALININSYHLKIAVLHHNSLCSDATENYAKCVFKILYELQHAYETGQLKILHSHSNALEQVKSIVCYYCSDFISILKKSMCFAVPESDSLSSFLDKVDNKIKGKHSLKWARI